MGAFKKFVTWLNGEEEDDDDLDAEYDEEYEDDEEEGEAKPSFFARLKDKVFPKRTNEDEEDEEEEAEGKESTEPARSNLASQNTLLTAGAYNSVRKSETNYANTVNRQAAASSQFSHAAQQQTAFQPKRQQAAYPASTTAQQPSYPQKTPFAPAKDRTASLNPTANAPQKQFSVMKPTSFEDSSSIVDVLRNGKAIIVNFEGSNPAISQRIMDFVCGCIYTIDGQILQISGYIFIVAPKDMDITGDYTAFLQQDSFGVPTFRQ